MRTPAVLFALFFALSLLGLASPARADWNDGRYNGNGWRNDHHQRRWHDGGDWGRPYRGGQGWNGDGGNWRGRIVISPGWGSPYPPPIYVPSPVYAPRPVYVPPPVYVQPPAPRPYCREYQGDAIINGSGQPFYGTACLQPDGSWRIVN